MKKLLFILLIALALESKAQYVTIPDANFATYLQGLIPAAMSGTQLDTTSLLVTTTTHTINVTGLTISNLFGVQFFKALTNLGCGTNPLTSLPSLPASLIYLFCVGNNTLSSLPTLPVSLKYLDCSHNSITTLPTLPNSLDTLNCMANQLTSLPTLPNTLIYLNCGANSLATLPTLPNNLTYLECSFSGLTSLPKLPNSLQYLDCYTDNIACFPTFPNSINNLQLGGNPFNCLPNYIHAMGSDTNAYPLCAAGNSNGCTVVPEICMVTTDSTSTFNYNIIYWNNTNYNNVDSFIIYRYDGISNSYLRIGALNKLISKFKDTAFSIGGPNGGNPLYASWKYKLAIRDTLGNIEMQSPYHQTMFVQQNNANFSWNAYTIEAGQSNPVTAYSFLRDDNNTGNWHVLVNTSGTASTDPNYASYPNGNWRVDALGFNCSNLTVSLSNTSKQASVGISQVKDINNQINIYPNPASNSVQVTYTGNSKIEEIILCDVLGKEIISTKETAIDMGGLQEGVYFIKVETNEGVLTKKVIVQH